MVIKENYMGYYFEIEFSNGVIIKDDATSLNIKELYEFDRTSMDMEVFNDYLNGLCNRFNLRPYNIKSVKIGYINKNMTNPVTYNLVKNNPYIQEVIPYISKGNTRNINNYIVNEYIIDQTSEVYQEMKNFIKKSLKENPNYFLRCYFPRDTKFKQQLYRLSDMYRSGEYNYSYEDANELAKLERQVSNELSIYKIFRLMASKRDRVDALNNKNNKVVTYKKHVSDEEYQKIVDNFEKEFNIDTSFEAKTQEYNEKYDEFIEPGEYDQMTGYTGERVK